MNVLGIGIDTIEIARFEKVTDDKGMKLLEKIFTPVEIKHSEKYRSRGAHLAGKFAAKEAVKKALPNGAEIGLAWPDIEIMNDSEGKPYVRLHGKAKQIADRSGLINIFVSISHSETTAVANAIAVGG